MNTHKLKTLVVPVTSGVMVTIKGDSTPREAGQIVCRPFPGGGGWHMYLEGLGYYPLSKVILHSLANVKEHAPLSAAARVDHGVEVETMGEHENRAADRGCCVSPCSRFFFSCGGIHVQRMSKPLEQGGENQVFMVEVEDEFFGRALDSSSDSIQRATQDWYQKGDLDQVLAWLLLKGMDHRKAKEVLASCGIAESE